MATAYNQWLNNRHIWFLVFKYNIELFYSRSILYESDTKNIDHKTSFRLKTREVQINNWIINL